MITRIWHGRTAKSNASEYLNFLRDEGTKEYRHTEGNLSIKVWKKEQGNETHFWTVTEWPSLDDVKRFAGDDFEKAKYYPFDTNMLLELEEKVEHYDSFDVSSSRVNQHLAQLRKLYEGSNWVGESFLEKLKPVTESEAFRQPLPGVHSVAELVWHCIYWRTVTLHRLQGDGNRYRDETAEELNFLSNDSLRAKGWKSLLQELDDSQRKLSDTLTGKTDDFLFNEYQPGYSYDFLIEGTIQHDYYHLGQIGLVLKMIRL